MDHPDALPESDWPQALAAGAALAADYLTGLGDGATAVLYGSAAEQEVHCYRGGDAVAHLTRMLATYPDHEIVRVWLLDGGAGIRDQAIGLADEIRVRARGWDPAVGPLTYQLAHESRWATPYDVEHPSMTVLRGGPEPVWEITFIETIYESDGEVGTAIDLGVGSSSFGALADLPPRFWTSIDRATTLAEVRTALHRFGARDTTADTRPSWAFGPAAAPDPALADRARELRTRFWNVISEAHLAARAREEAEGEE